MSQKPQHQSDAPAPAAETAPRAYAQDKPAAEPVWIASESVMLTAFRS